MPGDCILTLLDHGFQRGSGGDWYRDGDESHEGFVVDMTVEAPADDGCPVLGMVSVENIHTDDYFRCHVSGKDTPELVERMESAVEYIIGHWPVPKE